MVATTFAADTPLVVTGLVYRNGIAGNWIWWSMLPAGMMTVFLFARLWVRAGLLTDVEFAEMRYAGKPGAFLRGFRAIYLGLLVNCVILGWVTKAMTTIAAVVLGVSDRTALALCIFFLIPFTGIYVALGGLWGVLWTDLFQFVLKMGVVIAVAWYGVAAAGGMHALLAKLAALHAAAGPNASNLTSFFPDFSQGFASESLWTIPVITFCVYLGVQWWAFWYPGSEPGGGGYVAQRILSARNERDGAALGPVVQFRALRAALLAVDPRRDGGRRSLSSPRAARIGLRAARRRPSSARRARTARRRISRRIHVHDRHASQLGKFLPGFGFLSPLRAARPRRSATTLPSRAGSRSCS